MKIFIATFILISLMIAGTANAVTCCKPFAKQTILAGKFVLRGTANR